MSSAFYRTDRNCWVANIRALWSPRGKRTVLYIPEKRIRSESTAKADAKAYADEAERYCRVLEGAHEPEDVQHALRIGAITDKQAAALRTGAVVPVRGLETQRPTIRDAALAHPSSTRDSLAMQVYYLRNLDDFTTYTGVKNLSEVTLDNVLQWVSEMKRRKWKWDTRRHALIYLRRAAVMGTRQGLPNQLAGIRLDHQDRVRTAIRVWSLARIVQAIKAADDPRIAAALVLGGCLGLRPTEIQRVEVGDLVEDVLHVGLRESKNTASVRSLPVPALVLPYLTTLINKRTTGALLLPQGARSGPTLTSSGLHQLLADTLTAPKIAPKDLRKSFATWAAAKIPAADLERYLGHSSALHAAVTSRHYLAAHLADQLRPSAGLLSEAISGAQIPT